MNPLNTYYRSRRISNVATAAILGTEAKHPCVGRCAGRHRLDECNKLLSAIYPQQTATYLQTSTSMSKEAAREALRSAKSTDPRRARGEVGPRSQYLSVNKRTAPTDRRQKGRFRNEPRGSLANASDPASDVFRTKTMRSAARLGVLAVAAYCARSLRAAR